MFKMLLPSVECGVVVKHAKNCLQYKRPGFHPWVGKIPWRRAWQPSPVFLPGEYHGQRSLAGYSPWGCKESDMTEQLSTYMKSFSWTLLSPCSAPSPLFELRLDI